MIHIDIIDPDKLETKVDIDGDLQIKINDLIIIYLKRAEHVETLREGCQLFSEKEAQLLSTQPL